MSGITDGFAKNLAECVCMNFKFFFGRLNIQFDISLHETFLQLMLTKAEHNRYENVCMKI